MPRHTLEQCADTAHHVARYRLYLQVACREEAPLAASSLSVACTACTYYSVFQGRETSKAQILVGHKMCADIDVWFSSGQALADRFTTLETFRLPDMDNRIERASTALVSQARIFPPAPLLSYL